MSDKSAKPFSLPVLLDRFKTTVDGVGHSLLGPDFEGFVDQEIRDVTAQMKLAKERRNEAKANLLSATAKLAQIKEDLKEQEEQALKLLRGHRKGKAREVAASIAAVLAVRPDWETRLEQAIAAERQHQLAWDQLDRRLKLLKLKLGAYKASANLQRTQASLLRQPGAAPAMPETALKSAQRLRQTTAPSPAPEPEASHPVTETADQVLQRLEAVLKKSARSSRKSSTGKSA